MTKRYSSIAEFGTRMGEAAAAHVDLLWRDVMRAHGSVEAGAYFRLITGEGHPLGNLAIFRAADDTNAVEEAVMPLMTLSQPTAVLFVAGVSASVSEMLTARGFMAIPAMPAMAVDVRALAPTMLPEGYSFFRVTSEADWAEWADTVAAGFELPRGLARLLSPEVQGARPEEDAQLQFFGIRHQGRIVATTMLYLADGLAGIYCVATLPAERGKGLGAHVTAEALRAALPLGYGVGVLQATEAGHGVYRGLGFTDVGSVPMFIRMPGAGVSAETSSDATNGISFNPNGI